MVDRWKISKTVLKTLKMTPTQTQIFTEIHNITESNTQ
jgi:hypothetical protein